MAAEEDTVTLNDPNDDEFSNSSGSFSGFSPLREDEEHAEAAKKHKGKQKATSKTSKKASKKAKKTAKTSASAPIPERNISSENNKKSNSLSKLINKLSPDDIEQFRNLLGVAPQPFHYTDDEDMQTVYGCNLNNYPGLTIELTEESDSELASAPAKKQSKKQPLQPVAITDDLRNALFEEKDESSQSVSSETVAEYDLWDLPKLKQPEKGPAISQSLANLINTACTSQCITDSLMDKFKIPENCDKLSAPRVKTEFWKVMNKRAQGYDKYFSDTQNLVAAGMVSVIRLAEAMKGQIASNPEAKDLMTNTLTLMGQIQYNLSIRRRYMIRPHLKKKYQNLCNYNVQITSNLFGDDLAKEIKNCDAAVSVAKENYGYGGYRPQRSRGYFRGARGQRGGYRYQPYPPHYGYPQYYNHYGQYGSSFRGNSRGFAPMRGKRQAPSATVTSAPNEGT